MKVVCDRAERLDALRQGDSKQFGKKAPKVLAELCTGRDQVNEAIEELGWFQPPPEAPITAALDKAIASVALLIEGLDDLSANPEDTFFTQLEGAKNTVAALNQAIAQPVDQDKTPISLVYDLFQVPAGEHFATSALEPNTLRALSPLDDQSMEELSERLLSHLILPGSAWAPSPTVHLAAMLVSERPLVAHRMAAFTSVLVTDVYKQRPKQVLKALKEQRNRGPRQFASSKEIAIQIRLIGEAHAQGDVEAAALSTARLYSAAAEGPVRGMSLTLLELLGVTLPEQPSLTLLRDRLRGKTGSRMDYSYALEPEWRNAVDHREFHWDPIQQALDLRGEHVSMGDLSQRYDFGASGFAGAECGITLAVAASPRLLEEVDRASPLYEDRVLVEHRVAQGLAGQGIAPKVAVTPDGLTVGPVADKQVIDAIGGLVGSISSTKGIERYEVQFENAPPLIVPRDVLQRANRLRRRDGDNNRILDTEAVNPIFVKGLIELGTAPEEAITRGAKAAATGVVLEASSKEEISKASRVRRTAKAANLAARTIRESSRVAGTSSKMSRELEKSLRKVESSSDAYLQAGARNPDALLAELKNLLNLLDALPPPAFPWFETIKADDQAA